ncbi:MAG: flippase-like domain-containing protein [Candidatus Moranbacteria bacterium]|nr:flippase-like domain-containing protein [Candidatus Moranbacteria bacterium]
MKKIIFLLVKIAVSVGLVIWLIERVDWQVVRSHLYDASIPFLFLYMVLQLTGNIISTKKWQIIAGFKGLHFTLKEGFFAYLTGAFINNFLPSTIGGDAYRSLWLARRSGAKAASLSTVLFDRFIGLWTIALLALLSSVSLWKFFSVSTALSIVLIALVAFFIVDLLITYFYCCSWFIRFVARIPFLQVRRFFEEIIFYTKKHIWWKTCLWSTFFIFVGIVFSNFTLFHALGSTIDFFSFLSVIFLVTIISAVPLSINNIGIKEWAYVTFFSFVGVNAEIAITVALLSRFLQMIISFIALPKYLSDREK